MAVVPRVATLRIDDTATHGVFRQWVATAATQDTTAGQSVQITTVMSVGGPTSGVGLPSSLTLSLYSDNGTLIRSFALDTTTTSPQASTFWFTNDGTSTGSPHAGTVEIAIRATRASAVTYDVETDGTPDTPPTGNHAHTLDRGWIRGTTTSTTTISNVSLGGAKSTPAEYDETLFARTTLGAALYVARALTVNISNTTPALSAATNSATSGNFDATLANVIDDRFPAAVTTAATSLTVPNAILTGLPGTVLTATNDSISVDSRRLATHHFQVDDGIFARSKNVTSREMLSTQTGFLATRITTARTASGVNGLTLTQALTPTNPGTAVNPTSTTTATRDTEAGWSELLAWSSAKPGGTWTKSVDITAPSDSVSDAHLLSPTQTYTMLAPDPRVAVMIGFGSTTASEDDHLHAGDAVFVTMTALDRVSRLRIAPDPGSVFASFVRWNRALDRFEYLQANGTAWAHWAGTTTEAAVVALDTNGDGVTFRQYLDDTDTWAAVDLIAVQVSFKVGGTPYGDYIGRELTGSANDHSGADVDAIWTGEVT